MLIEKQSNFIEDICKVAVNLINFILGMMKIYIPENFLVYFHPLLGNIKEKQKKNKRWEIFDAKSNYQIKIEILKNIKAEKLFLNQK